MSEWISVDERLPERYRDVPIQLEDGSQHVGRLNHLGTWLIASYRQCRHQYASSKVVRWFDTPEPPK